MKTMIVGVVLVALSGCAGQRATIIRTTHSWGELALSGPYWDRVAEAVSLMATHCDGPFAVVNQDSETGFSQVPSPAQTHIQFVCPARVALRNYARSRDRTAGGARPVTGPLVVPGNPTPADEPTTLAPTSETADATVPAPVAPDAAPAERDESSAPGSPALSLPPPPPSETTASSTVASPASTPPTTDSSPSD